MPFDLVAEVTFFAGRADASSKANRMIRSQPRLVNTACWIASSSSVPG